MATSKKTEVEKMMERVSEALNKEYQATGSNIRREGEVISFPAWMSHDEAARSILSDKKNREEEIQTQFQVQCWPSDGLYALYRAVSDRFGRLVGQMERFWWGKIPAQNVTIQISPTEKVSVPTGHMVIPGVGITIDIATSERPNQKEGGIMQVAFTHPRKFEPFVKAIQEDVERLLKDDSIFKGQPMDSKFQFIDLAGFDPSMIVYSRRVKTQIEAEILSAIKHTNLWRSQKRQIKRGVLLAGKYGAGKSLTALNVAHVCHENGWTFIRFVLGDNISKTLQTALLHQPAVVFVEDINDEAGTDRTQEVNGVLDAMDGVLNKGAEVIVVMTTNHPEKISRAMLRPGRIDSFIEMDALDPDAVLHLVEVYSRKQGGGSFLIGEPDKDALFQAAEGYSPAFIAEAVKRAWAYALAAMNGSAEVEIEEMSYTFNDVVHALESLRFQFDKMNEGVEKVMPSLDAKIEEIVDKRIEPLKETLEDVHSLAEAIRDNQ